MLDVRFVSLNVSEGRRFLWGKTRASFSHAYHSYGHSIDWFLKSDDDSYFIIENLRRFLDKQDPNRLVYFGQRSSLGLGKYIHS